MDSSSQLAIAGLPSVMQLQRLPSTPSRACSLAVYISRTPGT